MRWEDLIGLEGALDAAELARLEALDDADRAELDAEVGERVRAEVGGIGLADRLRAAQGQPLVLRVLGAGALSGRVAAAGPDWLLLDLARTAAALVPLTAVVSVTGLSRAASTPGSEGQVASRLRLGFVLRRLVRDRVPVALVLVDGSAANGTLDRVGREYVELAEHALGDPRRPGRVHRVRAVPFAALAALHLG